MHIVFYAVPGILVLSFCAPRRLRAFVGVGLGLLVSGLVLLPMTLARESRFAAGPVAVGLTALACTLAVAIASALGATPDQLVGCVACGWVISLSVAIMAC